MSSAYATTEVAVTKSQAEVRDLLVKHGATQFTFGEGAGPHGHSYAGVEFVVDGLKVRLSVPLKTPTDKAVSSRLSRSRGKTRDQVLAAMMEQEAKRIWRVIAHNLKARMVAVEEGVESMEQAFLAHVVLPSSNHTVYEVLANDKRLELGTLQLPPPAGWAS